MSFINKLLGRTEKPLSWCPPAAPSCNADLDDKLDWLEACNYDISDRLGGSIITIISAFNVSRCTRMLETIDAILRIDMIMSKSGASQQSRSDAVIKAIRVSVSDHQTQEMILFYWLFFSEAYTLIYNDEIFARHIMKMSGNFDCMPHIFTQLVLEFARTRLPKR